MMILGDIRCGGKYGGTEERGKVGKETDSRLITSRVQKWVGYFR